MPLTDARARSWAWVAFGVCCLFFACDAAVAVLGWTVGPSSTQVHLSLTDAALVLMTMTFPVVGILIARRQPWNTLGWVMLTIGLVAFFPASAYADYGLVIDPGSLPGADVAAALTTAIWAPVLGLVATYLILLFPDGHLSSPRWRFVGWFSGSAIAYVYLVITLQPGTFEVGAHPDVENPLGIPLLGDLAPILLSGIIALPISFILCAAALVQRFRRSSGVERLQLKWLASAGVSVALLYLAAMVSSLVTGRISGDQGGDPTWLGVLQNVAVFSFVLIPIAIGVAILKHGLYEIDVVINKTVVFGTLAFFITAVYVAIVVGLGQLAGRGERPSIALSIVATAVVAVAFQPVQHRAQRFANRLVYGARATPYEVLARFSDRAGGGYDAAQLLPLMARTVAQGVRAGRADVWLVRGDGLVRGATWPTTGGQDQLTAGAEQPSAGQSSEPSGDRVVEVRHRGELLGVLAVSMAPGDSLTSTEDKLLEDVAAQASLVLRNVRLIEDLRSSRERLVTSQDEQRRRLERNLHDGAQQHLVAVALMIRTARAQLGTEASALGSALDQAADQLRQAIDELRELARGIHPAVLTERGLGPAIRSLAERSPVPVAVDCQLHDRPAPTVEAALYFVIAEALANVAKYAQADHVTVTVTERKTVLTLDVIDDGVGGADVTRGSGLRGLVDRLAVVGGTLTIESPPGAGTRLTCSVPKPSPARVAVEADTGPAVLTSGAAR